MQPLYSEIKMISNKPLFALVCDWGECFLVFFSMESQGHEAGFPFVLTVMRF